MKRIFSVMLLILLVGAMSFLSRVHAQESTPVERDNKVCPVSGETVGGMGQAIKVEHNGKVYNLCCAMCIKTFKKNPDNFAAIVEESAAADHDAVEGTDEDQEGHDAHDTHHMHP